jgi:nickel-dependent lactate racemase
VIVKLPFAGETVAVDLRGMRVRPLSPSAPRGGRNLESLLGAAIDHPIIGDPLRELARNRRSATVIVPDATRKIDLPRILPVILDRLRSEGIKESGIVILVACGTHPAVCDDVLRELTGPLPPGVSVVQHDSRDGDVLVDVGELRPGIRLRLHRAAVEADLLVTVGTVRHHYFAGFGGGPKMVFPGVAGYEEIQANHSLVLAPANGGGRVRHPDCEPGRLGGNPVAEEIARVADAHPPTMSVCLVEGQAGETAWAAAGPWREVFDLSVVQTRSWYEVPGNQLFEVMVASGGGSPSDSTLIQAHKGLDAACRFLAPGGRLLYVAAIDRGAGSDAMLPFLERPDPDEILDSLNRAWVQYGHTTLRLLEKTRRHRVALHSHLDPSLATRLGFEPVEAVDDVIESWRRECPGVTVGVMASGAVYPRS